MQPGPVSVLACPQCERKVSTAGLHKSGLFYVGGSSDSAGQIPPGFRYQDFHECLTCGYFFLLREGKDCGQYRVPQLDTDSLQKNYYTFKRAIDSRVNSTWDTRYYRLLETWWSYNALATRFDQEPLKSVVQDARSSVLLSNENPFPSAQEIPPHVLHRKWLDINSDWPKEPEKTERQIHFYESFVLPNLVYSLERYLFYARTDISLENREQKSNWSKEIMRQHWADEGAFIEPIIAELSISVVEESCFEDFLLKADQLRTIGQFRQSEAKLGEMKVKLIELMNANQQLMQQVRKKDPRRFTFQYELDRWNRFKVLVKAALGW